jgi:hypothetical protein
MRDSIPALSVVLPSSQVLLLLSMSVGACRRGLNGTLRGIAAAAILQRRSLSFPAMPRPASPATAQSTPTESPPPIQTPVSASVPCLPTATACAIAVSIGPWSSKASTCSPVSHAEMPPRILLPNLMRADATASRVGPDDRNVQLRESSPDHRRNRL